MSIARAHTILYVHDQPRSARFWQQTLGIAPTLDVPGMTEFPLLGGSVLGLMPEDGIARLLPTMPRPHAASGIPRAELYLVVEDPAAFHGRALAAGAKELSALQPRDWGDEAAYSLDPDGHVVAFARPVG